MKFLLFAGILGYISSFRSGFHLPRLARSTTTFNSYGGLRLNRRLNSTPGTELEPANRDAVLGVLNRIFDPESGLNLVEAGLVSDLEVSADGFVKFRLAGSNDEMKSLCSSELSSLEWIKKIDIVTFKKMNSVVEDISDQTPRGMSKIKHIIAVSSCKGGVGKSTVSVNLAFTLKNAGARVGILDADIYGPSLPTMTKPISTEVVFASNQLQPLDYEGVKLMSMGFINKGAAIMRGPMVNQILNQFVSLCDWGELDYLIVDMPPGTGDIQLTLAQIMNISAAVIVTTPQRLSFVDVVKGIDLFDTVNVPCVAVVENMASYSTYSFPPEFFESVGKIVASVAAASTAFNKDPTASIPAVTDTIRKAIEKQKQPFRVFGLGHLQRLQDMWGIENLISLPLVEEVSTCADAGVPYVLANPTSTVALAMTDLAAGVVKELVKMSKAGKAEPSLVYDPVAKDIVFNGEQRVSPMSLRCSCRCAVCVEEFTGRTLLQAEAVPVDIRPTGMSKIGRYAMSVDWSDGHKSLFPYRQIGALVQSENAKV